MKRILFNVAFLGVSALALIPATQTAYAATELQLTISPKVCVVDVIQDGSSQTLQTSSPDCQTTLPVLLTQESAEGASNPLFALPFAGANESGAIAIQPARQDSLAPVTSNATQVTPITHSSRLVALSAGIGLAVITTAVGLDLALFELRYSRTVTQWFRRVRRNRGS